MSAPRPWLWHESAALLHFRGEGWMQEPCASCESRHRDRGGSGCQAQALTGEAAAADPACGLVPANLLVKNAIAEARAPRVSSLELRRGPSVANHPEQA